MITMPRRASRVVPKSDLLVITIVSKRGNGARRRSMHLVAGGTRCCPGQGCLRLIKHLLHRLLLWNWMMTTFPDAPQQEVNQGQHDQKKQ